MFMLSPSLPRYCSGNSHGVPGMISFNPHYNPAGSVPPPSFTNTDTEMRGQENLLKFTEAEGGGASIGTHIRLTPVHNITAFLLPT